MKRPPPPLNLVRSFEAAARHLSFTRAAEELGYTQAAISTHVRALENYVGRPLFKRHARSLELTEIGAAFLPALRQALTQIDTATEAIVTSSRDQSVIVTCPISLAENWLPGVLSAFREEAPRTEVMVHATVWDDTVDEIADLVLSIHRLDEAPPGAERLFPDQLALVCAPSVAERLAGGAAPHGLPRIAIAGRQEYWTLMEAALGWPHLDRSNALKTNSSNIALELAAAGLGLTIAPVSLTATYIARGLLAEPLAARAPSPYSYFLRSGTGPLRPPVRRLKAALQRQASVFG